MCVVKFNNGKCKLMNRSKLGRAVREVLTSARAEHRLICGLVPAIAHLEKASDEVVLCVVPQTRPGDAATHMQTVLLQAFCYENDIPVIQVDSGEKLAKYCGKQKQQRISLNNSECLCALVINKDISTWWNDGGNNKDINEDEGYLSAAEQVLANFYECSLEESPRPIIELPI